MYAVLAPAKTFDMTPGPPGLQATQPVLGQRAAVLIERVKELSPRDISRLTKTSDAVAEQAWQAYQRLQVPVPENEGVQAALAFAGDLAIGLDARSLSMDELRWAQDKVGVLSGIFGLLRPLDLVLPHRLEMSTALQTQHGRNLYAFWGAAIARAIRAQLADKPVNVVVNLASNELIKAIPRSALGASILTPVFEELEPGKKPRTIVVHTKRARGAMARFVIQQRVQTVVQLQGFDGLGYRYSAARSRREKLVFQRFFG